MVHERFIHEFTEKAFSLGFAAVGFSRPDRPAHLDAFLRWLREGRHGEMSWLGQNLEVRENPRHLFPECRAIVSLALPYSWSKPATPEGLTVSRYARPDAPDYHLELKNLCRELGEMIGKAYPESRLRVCVDSAPLFERGIAQKAGVGFIGKNCMLIVPDAGSGVFLAEILTTADLPFQAATPLKSLCGDCTRCLDACPTGALAAPHMLDASKCLAYLTIEWKGEVGRETAEKMGRCFLGCDVCQEVCPMNPSDMAVRVALPSAGEFFRMDEHEFGRRFGRTALKRPGLKKIRSNLRAMAMTASTPNLPRGAPG